MHVSYSAGFLFTFRDLVKCRLLKSLNTNIMLLECIKEICGYFITISLHLLNYDMQWDV